MKKKLCYLIVLLIFSNFSISQNIKFDKIVKKNYEIIEVNIIKLSEQEVTFSFPNENIANTMELSKIGNIILKSGETLNFNIEKETIQSINNVESDSKQAENQFVNLKTIAILPIPFVNTNSKENSSEMAKFAQNDFYSKLIELSSKKNSLKIQDIRLTNSLLKKAGIDHTNIDEVLIEKLEQILGVEYVLASKVSYVVTTDKINSKSGNTTIKDKSNTETKINDSTVSVYSEEINFYYNVFLDI